MISWVIGSGGLLGSAIQRSIHQHGNEIFTPPFRFRWKDHDGLKHQIEAATASFRTFVGNNDHWTIYWAAGIGNMSSSQAELESETRALSWLRNFVSLQPQEFQSRGSITFASSAGAIYAGSSEEIITETTADAPTTAYAKEKIRQEDLLKMFALERNAPSSLIARMSTLYGPGQAVSKQQGLVAHIARCIIRNRPINIFVPLDTIRDYIYVDDAASMLTCASDNFNRAERTKTIIVASELPTTIAEIVATYKRLTRKNPRIFTSTTALSNVYNPQILFRSLNELNIKPFRRTSLPVGISQVIASEKKVYAQSAL